MSKIIIIDYEMGNLFSILQAVKYNNGEAEISSDPDKIENADKLILPGVGAFEKAMNELQKRNISESIFEFVKRGRPLLGICLGMQLLFSESYEFGHHKGLDLIKGKVSRFNESDSEEKKFKIPQIGWNRISPSPKEWSSTILEGINDKDYFYFVHSFICVPDDPDLILSETSYGIDCFCSTTNMDNIWGCQFHPEKSGKKGLLIYKNFIQKL